MFFKSIDLYTYQLKLKPSSQCWPLHGFDALSGQPALLEIKQKKKKKKKSVSGSRCRNVYVHIIIPWLYRILAADWNAFSEVARCRFELPNVPPLLYVMCQKNKRCDDYWDMQ